MTAPPAAYLLGETRAHLLRLVEGLDRAALLHVPEGASNNVLWNLGHVAVTQQLLHYGLSGLPLGVSERLVAQCRKGTAPADWESPPDVPEVLDLLTALPPRLVADYEAGRFTAFRSYPTSTGIVLDSINQAIAFNAYHEGLHASTVRRLVAAL